MIKQRGWGELLDQKKSWQKNHSKGSFWTKSPLWRLEPSWFMQRDLYSVSPSAEFAFRCSPSVRKRGYSSPILAQSFLGVYYNSISWFYVLTHESTGLWNSAWATFPSFHEHQSKRSAESTVLCSDRYSLWLANFICRAIKLALEMDHAAAGLSCCPLTGEVPGRKLVEVLQQGLGH